MLDSIICDIIVTSLKVHFWHENVKKKFIMNDFYIDVIT